MTDGSPVVWNPCAIDDLDAIVAFIAEDNPAAAERLRDRIKRAASDISFRPLIYRAGRVAGTREMVVHPNYIVVYRIVNHRIEILGVTHARRR